MARGGLNMHGYLEKSFSLVGKTAVITGGGGTLCGAIAEAFLKSGAETVLWGRTMKNLEDKKARLIEAGCPKDKIKLCQVDLSCERSAVDALNAVCKDTEKVDILVNGVGGSGVRKPIIDTALADFKEILDLNLIAGCFLPSKYFAEYWIKNEIKGCILNIASMASFNPLSGAWAYSSAKAAVMNQTMEMGRELAPHGIRVNAIAPGFFLGKQNRHLLVNDDGSLTERGKRVLDHTPMERFGKAEELGAASVFLASEGSGFITGTTLPIDGGFLCHNI